MMGKLRAIRWSSLFSMCVIAAGGCAHFGQVDRINKLDNGLTLVLPGVEGEGWLSDNMASGLQDGGIEGAIEVHDWTSGQAIRSLEHLVSFDKNQHESFRLADRIMTYQDAFPGRPIHLIGHSGGAAVILMAIQQLPAPYRVNKIALLSPAISAAFPLDQLLGSVDQIYSFHSRFDFQLTIGTRMLGTIDRDFGPAAGGPGFRNCSQNLVQIPYQIAMLRSGHPGGHLGSTRYLFVKDWVSPLLSNDNN